MSAIPADEVAERKNKIGSNIARIRDTQRITQTKLSKLTGGEVSQGFISRVESGRQDVTTEVLLHLASALKVPVTAFYEGVPSGWGDEEQSSFAQFLASDLAEGIRADEKRALQRSFYPFGTPCSLSEWKAALELYRASERRRKLKTKQ